MQHRVALLVVIGHAPFPQLALNFLNTLPRIEAFVGRHDPPYIAKIYRPGSDDLAKDPTAPGRIALWHPK